MSMITLKPSRSPKRHHAYRVVEPLRVWRAVGAAFVRVWRTFGAVLGALARPDAKRANGSSGRGDSQMVPNRCS